MAPRPIVPPKSSAVLNRMHNAPQPNRFPSVISLDRANTSKTLPSLPAVGRSNSCSSPKTPPISPNYSYPSSIPRPVYYPKTNPITVSSSSLNQTKSPPMVVAATFRNGGTFQTVQLRKNPLQQPVVPIVPVPKVETNIKQNNANNVHDDDDSDGEDYAYDYVCLESRKKLNAEDENIKNTLEDLNIQRKYEELALNSCEEEAKEHLEGLQKTFKNLNIQNRAMSNHFLSSYR